MQNTTACPGTIFIRSLGGDKSRGILQLGALRLPCALGRAGISAFKREGDGATPRAVLRIIGGFRQKKPQPPLPPCPVPLRRASAADGWCDAQRDRNYNRPVRLPYAASAEQLSRADGLYAVGFILDWNMRPRRRGRGSAVFFHIARAKSISATEGASNSAARKSAAPKSAALPLFHPTAGCIAVSERAIRRLMPHLRQGMAVKILG